jgi:hypothetical protein
MKAPLLVLALLFMPAAHSQPAKKDEAKKPEAAKPAEDSQKKKRARPRIGLQRDGTSVGDDASGGGARSADSSKGGTPGTPSGSFTGTMPKP